MEGEYQVTPKRQEIPLVDIQEAGPHRHGCVAQQGEQTTTVEKQVGEEPLCSNTIEDGIVHIQGLEVDTRGKVRVEALGKTFAYCQLKRNDGILSVGQENLQMS